MRDQRHPEDSFGDLRNFGIRLCDFDAPTLPAATRVNLRFNHDAPADLFRSRLSFSDAERHLPARHRDVVPGQYGLGLIFVYFHFET